MVSRNRLKCKLRIEQYVGNKLNEIKTINHRKAKQKLDDRDLNCRIKITIVNSR